MKIYMQGFKSVSEGQFVAIGNKLTFLVGPNSAGKSAVLVALEKLSGGSPTFDLEVNLIHKNPRRDGVISACHSLGVEWTDGKIKYGNFATYFSNNALENIDPQALKHIQNLQLDIKETEIDDATRLNYRESLYVNGSLSVGENKLGRRQYNKVERLLLKQVTLSSDQTIADLESMDEKTQSTFKEYMVWAIEVMRSAENIQREKSMGDKLGRPQSFYKVEADAAAEIVSEWKIYLSGGIFHWDLFLLKVAVRNSFSGLRRQQMLNILERYNSKVAKYKDTISNQASKTYPGRNFGLSVVSAERRLPSSADLECFLGAEHYSNNIYHELMESKVGNIWNSTTDTLGRGVAESLFDRVNTALSDNLFSDNGYQVRLTSKALVSKQLWDERRDEVQDVNTDENEFLCKLSLVDSHGRSLKFSDVGSGIGYVLPVLIDIFRFSNFGKIVFLQQPELHLHPKLQTNLTDVLIEAAEHKRIIAETHSEHMILRALKRIRQTTNGTIQDPALNLKPEDVAVNYFEPLPDGSTKVHILRISKDGDFLDRWPNGFFEERSQELFDE